MNEETKYWFWKDRPKSVKIDPDKIKAYTRKTKIREIIEKYAIAEWSRDEYMAQECIIGECFNDLQKDLYEFLLSEIEKI